MILKLAQLVGVPTWAVKIGIVVITALLAIWAYSAWRDSVIDEYEAEVLANVEVVTDEAETAADAELDRAVTDFSKQMEKNRKEIQDAQNENRSPLDALFD
jgi:hypothetical protein